MITAFLILAVLLVVAPMVGARPQQVPTLTGFGLVTVDRAGRVTVTPC
jgi:hypothetical protein